MWIIVPQNEALLILAQGEMGCGLKSDTILFPTPHRAPSKKNVQMRGHPRITKNMESIGKMEGKDQNIQMENGQTILKKRTLTPNLQQSA